jgi:hypothetical protein
MGQRLSGCWLLGVLGDAKLGHQGGEQNRRVLAFVHAQLVAQVLNLLNQAAVSLGRDEDRRRATVVHKHDVLIAYFAGKLAQPGTGFAYGNDLAHPKMSFRSQIRVTVTARAASSTM